MEEYINLNGNYFVRDEPVLKYTNRGFQYGDALFENMHANGTTVQFFNDHMEHLTGSMKYLKMEMPYNLKNDRIKQEIIKLLHKNRHLKGAWVRITVFRNNGGSFTPTDDSCSYLIESHKLNNDVYKLNEKGLIVDVYQEHKKPVSPLSTLQTTNALINILAGTFQKAHNLDNCLLINQKNELTEAIDSNLFLVMGDYIKTPPLKSGCVDGIIRKKIFEFSWELGYKISHQHPVFYEDLMNADEMFLTNAVEGIKWVSGIRKKRYFKNTAKKLMALLNEKTRIDRY